MPGSAGSPAGAARPRRRPRPQERGGARAERRGRSGPDAGPAGRARGARSRWLVAVEGDAPLQGRGVVAEGRHRRSEPRCRSSRGGGHAHTRHRRLPSRSCARAAAAASSPAPAVAQAKLQSNPGGYHGELDFPISWKRYYSYAEWTEDHARSSRSKYRQLADIQSHRQEPHGPRPVRC
ncbi:MAG: hypothetical protein MZU84_04585 [Sphingobacterium sp.]|nr:hypothetical protein [Sphingobacterium sp.]